jgi:hypothetical protein
MLNKDIEGQDKYLDINIPIKGAIPKNKIREAREVACKIKEFIASGGVIHKFKIKKWSDK